VGKTFEPFRHTYVAKDVALYALACGATEAELDLVLDSRGPKVLPTFPVVFVMSAMTDALQRLGGNIIMLVHGAQRCTVPRPLPPEAEVVTTARIEAVYDKGKGALAVFRTESTDDAGTRLAETEWQIYYRGEGGFGGDRGPEAAAEEPADGEAPSAVVDMPTAGHQALLYRWASGDPNPIHLEPSVAEQVGFPRPILHGLCTFGHAARAIVQTCCEGDSDRLRSIEGRFSKPVLPGQVLSTHIWRRPDGALFSTAVGDAPVLVRGRAGTG
jgi:acyl dehydratase